MHTFYQTTSAIEHLEAQVSDAERSVFQLFYDSRLVINGSGGMFFAFSGNATDGHEFIPELSKRGVNQWVISDKKWGNWLKESKGNHNWILVESPIKALQQLAAWHRTYFSLPVIGITGSNGKTIVKEWLAQLIGPDFLVCKSPKSFNSQLGVPVSVWNLAPAHTLGIFEAGISKLDEMVVLENIIQPTIGIFTNLGLAHDAGFESQSQKMAEKLKLFCQTPVLILENSFAQQWSNEIKTNCPNTKLIIWEWIENRSGASTLRMGGTDYSFVLPFSDQASQQNLGNALAASITLGIGASELFGRLANLSSPDMRLSLKDGQHGMLIVDDSYTNDLAGLEAALQFAHLQRKPGQSLSVVLSDLENNTLNESTIWNSVHELLKTYQVNSLVSIGQPRKGREGEDNIVQYHFSNVAEAVAGLKSNQLENQVVLIKGSRKFGLEKLVKAWQKKIHGTQLEINLDALIQNLNFYRGQLPPGTAVMAMVKALGYGSGGEEIARALAYHRVDYLAVAYVDEGVMLRQSGIQTPIMVMNPTPDSLEELIRHQLEPEIYSFRMLDAFIETVSNLQPIAIPGIHLKIDTGMHRLGFDFALADSLAERIAAHSFIRVLSVFSHLAGADSDELNDYSHSQINRFESVCSILQSRLKSNFKRHLLNSAGILRFPEATYEMVRLGIGLYGVEVNSWFQDQLEPVSTLKTTISQITSLKKGETVGYGRIGILERDSQIATLAIGYADGFRRAFSKGKAKVKIGNTWVPVVGNVCMDMTMVDVTDCQAEEGDEVIIFDGVESLESLSMAANTIPYEILTGIGQRVKRVFFRQ